ncbi:hypothetical protein CTAM01_12140, partial [Colletotrichum tamarilloi]
LPRQGVTGGNPQQQQRRPPHTPHARRPHAHSHTPRPLTPDRHQHCTDLSLSCPLPSCPSHAQLCISLPPTSRHRRRQRRLRLRQTTTTATDNRPPPIDDTGKSSTPSINIDNHPRDIPGLSILPFRHPHFPSRALRLSHALIRHSQPPTTTLGSRYVRCVLPPSIASNLASDRRLTTTTQ